MSTEEAIKPVSEEIADDITAKHTYVLCTKLERRGMTYDEKNNLRPDPEYPKQRNLMTRSSIIWTGGIDPFLKKERARGKYIIQYYDGCTTLFVDEQPKDKETRDQLIRSTRELFFQNGYLHIYGYDTMLKTYADWASWNEGSQYKVPTVDPVYRLLDPEKERELEGISVDDVEKALAIAKGADEKSMIIHAKFLDVPEIDFKTGNKLTPKSVRVEYRKAAMTNTKKFLETHNDKTLSIRYWIERAMENGEINTTVIPNHAAWGKKGKVICDISGLKEYSLILNRLVEFSQTNEGTEFKQQLEALYR